MSRGAGPLRFSAVSASPGELNLVSDITIRNSRGNNARARVFYVLRRYYYRDTSERTTRNGPSGTTVARRPRILRISPERWSVVRPRPNRKRFRVSRTDSILLLLLLHGLAPVVGGWYVRSAIRNYRTTI